MKFIFNACPCCYVHSKSNIESKYATKDKDKIRCKNCGWTGSWAEMSKYIFKDKER